MSKLMADLYSKDYDFSVINEKPDLSYLIATVPRSGSTHLCLTLWQTGVLGAPLEYMNQVPNGAIYNRVRSWSQDGYWSGLQRIRQSPNRVFGHKGFVQCFTKLGGTSTETLSQIYSDKVIYLTRADKVSQAISYARAAHTKKWFSDANQCRCDEISMEQIEEASRWIEHQEWGWSRLFDITDTTPYRVTYEDVIADPSAAIDNICSYLEVDRRGANPISLPALAIQRDNITSDLAARYHAFAAKRNTSPM